MASPATPGPTPRATRHGARCSSRSRGAPPPSPSTSVPTTLNDHTVAGDTAAGRMRGAAPSGPRSSGSGPGSPRSSTPTSSTAPRSSASTPRPSCTRSTRGRCGPTGCPSPPPTSPTPGSRSEAVPPTSTARPTRWRRRSATATSLRSRARTTGAPSPSCSAPRSPTGPSLFDDLLPAHVAEQVGWNHGFDHFDRRRLRLGRARGRSSSWQPGAADRPGAQPAVVGEPAQPRPRRGAGGQRRTRRSTPHWVRGSVQVAYPSDFDQSFMAQAVVVAGAADPGRAWARRMLQLEFNVRRAPLTAVAVRQGIAHAIDRAGIVQSVGQPEDHSVWEDNDHLVPNGEPGYADDASGYEKADPVDVGAPARTERPDRRRPRDVDAARQAGEPRPRVGGRRPVVGGGRPDRGRAARGGGLRRRRHADVDRRSCTASTLPTGAFDLALVPVDATRLSERARATCSRHRRPSPAGRRSAGLVGLRRPEDRRALHPGRAGAGATSGPCHLPADRSGPVDGHADAAAVRRADDARVVGVAVGASPTTRGDSGPCGA